MIDVVLFFFLLLKRIVLLSKNEKKGRKMDFIDILSKINRWCSDYSFFWASSVYPHLRLENLYLKAALNLNEIWPALGKFIELWIWGHLGLELIENSLIRKRLAGAIFGKTSIICRPE